MRSIRIIALALVALLGLVSCNRDPAAAKRRYVESGDKYFNKARYKEASIQYRNALKIDAKYGLAHYKLALTALKVTPPDFVAAVRSLRRAMELVGQDRQERWDALVKLTEIYLSPLVTHDEQVMKEIAANCDALLQRDPKSFDGHRLTADLKYVSAAAARKVRKTEEDQKFLDEALEEYRAAEAIQPGNEGVAIQIARVFWLKKDIPAAERYFNKVLEKNKNSLLAYGDYYKMLWSQDKLSEAEQLLRTGYQNNPKEYAFLITLALLHLKQQRRDEMLQDLAVLKSKAGEYPGAYQDVGDFYQRVGDADSAVREYREGMTKDPKNKATYQKRMVEVLMRQGKKAEAGDITAQILKDDPKDADALGLKASLLLDKGDIAKALVELQQAVTRSPDNFVARYDLGRAYVMNGEVEQGRQQFQKAIEMRPDYLPARLALAQVQVARSEFEAAVRSAQEILKIYPDHPSARLIESAALMGQRKFAESRQVLDAMLKANPSSPEVMFQVGVVNLAENKYKEAEESFRKAYQLNPANPRGLMGVVETYMAQNKPDQAIQVLEAESAKAPARMDFHLALGNIEVRAGRWDKAVAEFQKVLDSTEKGTKARGEMYLRIGETQRRKGDFAAAVSALQAARQTLPEDERVLGALALSLDGANRWPEAKQVYQTVVKLYPTNGVAMNNLAFGMSENGDNLDEALSLAQRAKQLLNIPEVNDTMGWIYLKKNLADNAIRIFEDLVTKQPNISTFRYHLGMAYSQKGDRARALQELKKALEGNPKGKEDQAIRDLIKRLG